MHQAFAVDAMAHARAHVPFDRNFGLRERLRGMEKRLNGDHLVLVAMHEKDRRRAVASACRCSSPTRVPE